MAGNVYLGRRAHGTAENEHDEWATQPDRVMNWLCDGYRFRFNQHRSKRMKTVIDEAGERALVPLGRTATDISDKDARLAHPHLSALPMHVLQAPERLESKEWWAAVERRATNAGRSRKSGGMPGFQKRLRSDQAFTIWHNGGKNANLVRTGRKSGILTITGRNPSGKYGRASNLGWSVRIRVTLTQEILEYTSVRVNWTRGEVVFVSPPAGPENVVGGAGTIGVDVGIARAATDSTGAFWRPPDVKPLIAKRKTLERKMARQQRQAKTDGRDFRSSDRYQATRTKKSAIDTKMARIRDDFAHKTATEIIRTADAIRVEDLNLAGMSRKARGKGAAAKRGLNRGLANAALGNLLSKIEYKAKAAGVEHRLVNPRFTSQRCHECGHTARDNRKTQAAFVCVKCGHTANADHNAALNIRDATPLPEKPRKEHNPNKPVGSPPDGERQEGRPSDRAAARQRARSSHVSCDGSTRRTVNRSLVSR